MMTLIESFSSLNRLKLSIAWLARFKLYLHSQITGTNLPPQQPISVAELEKSELDLIQYVQRNNFVHEMSCIERSQQIPRKSCLYRLDPIMADGLLRVGGRLDNASLAFDVKQGCATFFTGGPLSKILTTSRASHLQICIKL